LNAPGLRANLQDVFRTQPNSLVGRVVTLAPLEPFEATGQAAFKARCIDLERPV
jgi:hypothetical protein